MKQEFLVSTSKEQGLEKEQAEEKARLMRLMAEAEAGEVGEEIESQTKIVGTHDYAEAEVVLALSLMKQA